ncbi:MAG: D-2-hydroxyacid dehydrogenase family protein [Burkholderiaceae bacterium]
MKIAIIDDYQDSVRHLPCFSLLDGLDVKIFNSSAKGAGQLAIRLAPFDALVLIRERTSLPRALLARLPALKLICQTGRIGPHIDLATAAERGIVVIEGAGDPVAPAELTWALIMAASRKIPQYAGLLKQGLWQTASIHAVHNGLGRVVRGRTLGIWGYGRIGRLVAGYAQAFGMTVQIWGSEKSRAQALADGLQVASSRAAFFSQVDVLSLHLRLSELTHHLITASDLALMKADALLVNTSRAELLAPGVLEAALRSGRPAFAATDVFDAEPVLPTATILQLENLLATPHIGFVEQESYEHYFRPAFEAIVAFANGQPPASSPA